MDKVVGLSVDDIRFDFGKADIRPEYHDELEALAKFLQEHPNATALVQGFTIAIMGLVLAIGLVVDDAIVVVEAVELKIEQGLSPKEATLKAMEEVSGRPWYRRSDGRCRSE